MAVDHNGDLCRAKIVYTQDTSPPRLACGHGHCVDHEQSICLAPTTFSALNRKASTPRIIPSGTDEVATKILGEYCIFLQWMQRCRKQLDVLYPLATIFTVYSLHAKHNILVSCGSTTWEHHFLINIPATNNPSPPDHAVSPIKSATCTNRASFPTGCGAQL